MVVRMAAEGPPRRGLLNAGLLHDARCVSMRRRRPVQGVSATPLAGASSRGRVCQVSADPIARHAGSGKTSGRTPAFATSGPDKPRTAKALTKALRGRRYLGTPRGMEPSSSTTTCSFLHPRRRFFPDDQGPSPSMDKPVLSQNEMEGLNGASPVEQGRLQRAAASGQGGGGQVFGVRAPSAAAKPPR